MDPNAIWIGNDHGKHAISLGLIQSAEQAMSGGQLWTPEIPEKG